jgi:hypothetical protein
MNDILKPMIEAARKVTMNSAEREAQRRSFAYGNTAIENSRITREMVDVQAKRLNESRGNDG